MLCTQKKLWEECGDSDIPFASMCVKCHFWVVSRAEKHSVFEFQIVKKIFWLGLIDPFSYLCWLRYLFKWIVGYFKRSFFTYFLSFFFSFYTATTPHEDYVQVGCVLLPRYKSARKKNLKNDKVKKTVQELKQVKNWSFIKTFWHYY